MPTIDFYSALDTVVACARTMDSEQISIVNATRRVLSESVYTPMDMPPFRKSAVDGYACRSDDVRDNNKGLLVLETIAAGAVPTQVVVQGTCSKIMTGAPVPNGADMVMMLEDSFQEGDLVFSDHAFKGAFKTNIAARGEDFEKDEEVLPKGTLLLPQHIALLAACGMSTLHVYKRIHVGIISTGDELREPRDGSVLPFGKIYNSNAWQLVSLMAVYGAIPAYYGIARDTTERTLELLEKALRENDVVLLSGGVSEGDYDFVPKAMAQLGFEIQFDRISVKPGKPTTFATRDITEGGKTRRQYIFGLPGNPVSTYAQCVLLVHPLLASMQYIEKHTKTVDLPICVKYKRHHTSRMLYLPAHIRSNGTWIPLEYHGSGHISALTQADALARIPQGKAELDKGDIATLIIIPR